MSFRVGIGRGALLAALALSLMSAAPSSAATWTVTKLSDDWVGGMLFGISCPTPSLCVAAGADSLIATTANPTGGRVAWKTFHPRAEDHQFEAPSEPGKVVYPGEQIRGISCPSSGLCVGAGFDDRILSSTDPSGGVSAWKVVPLSGENETRTHMTGIACPSPALCVAVAYGGKVIHSTNPTGEASAWTATELGTPLDLRGISCPTVSFCVAVDNEGRIVTSTDPTGPASAWSLAGAPGGASSLNGISCPTTSLCVTGNAGLMITSTNPTGGVGAWNAVAAGTGLPVKGVSCLTTSACAAVDNNSDMIVSTDPTGGAGAWSFTNVMPGPLSPEGNFNGMFAISCPTTSLCAAAGQREQIITSSDPFAVDTPRALQKSKRLRVVITRHPGKRVKPRKGGARSTFRFHATGKVARFNCRLIGGTGSNRAGARRSRFSTCKSPQRYRLPEGIYAFKVRAISPTGRKGPATSYHFRVGGLSEGEPVGSCRPRMPGLAFRPCINAR
jgi:hypothetical protein